MNEKNKSLSSQATYYFIGKIIATGVIFFVPYVLVRVFSKEDFGQFAQILLIYEFFFRIFQFGINQSLYYFIPTEIKNKSYYVTNALLTLVATGISAILILTIFRTEIALLFDAEKFQLLLPLCGLHLLFMLISSSLEPLLIIESEAEIASFYEVFSQILRAVSIIIIVYVYQTVLSAVIGLLIYSFTRFVIYLHFVLKRYGLKIDSKNIPLFKRQLSYTIPIGFSGILSNSYKQIDKFILSIFFTPGIYAIYTVGNFKIPFIQLLFKSVGEVVLPRAVKLLKNSKIDRFLTLWRGLLIRFAFIGIGSFFLLQTVAYDLITLIFTSSYQESIPIFRLVLFFIFGEMLQYGIILRTLGNTKAIFKSNLFSFIFAIPITYLLVSNYGITGAAISALSGFFINVTLQLTYSVKGLKRKVSEIFPISEILKFSIIGFILFIIIIFTQEHIEHQLLRIGISSIIFIIPYTFICIKMNLYNIFQEDIIKKIISLRHIVHL